MVRIGMAGLLAGAVTVAAVAQQSGPRIAPRDVLKVSVWAADSLTRSFTVDPDGTIDFPEVGRVQAAGLTARELEGQLARRLVEGKIMRDPRITIDLEQVPTKRVTVSGPGVASPATIPFAGELRVLEALLKAGSVTREAAPELLVVRNAPIPVSTARGGTEEEFEVIRVSLRELQGPNVAAHNLVLQDGDQVIVPKAEQVFITGYVASPGPYTVPPGTTVEQALALAGGATELAALNRITIKRKGQDEPMRARLTDIVEPGDTLQVPKRRM